MTRLSVQEVLALVDYCPSTGVLTWRERTGQPCWQHSWNSKYSGKPINRKCRQGYVDVCINGKTYLGHRIAWAAIHGVWPTGEIDHIDGDRGNNRISNLRDVSHKENGRNVKRSVKNTSGVVGVSWRETDKKWWASITVDGKTFALGLYSDFDDAVTARKTAQTALRFHPNHGRPA